MIAPTGKDDFGIRGFARYEVSAPRLKLYLKCLQLTSKNLIIIFIINLKCTIYFSCSCFQVKLLKAERFKDKIIIILPTNGYVFEEINDLISTSCL